MTGIQEAAKFAVSDLDLAIATDTGMVVRDQKVFRTGTFTSMQGSTRTYSHQDLDLAVENFVKLRELNIIPNVPVREDHSTSIKDVVAYFTDVRRFGDFLYADWEWVSLDAETKWNEKKYRNKSIEIGRYVTNEGTVYDPVVLGLAFVDHPAVEGLYRIAQSGDEMTTNTPEAQAAADQAAADKKAKEAADAATPPATPPVEPVVPPVVEPVVPPVEPVGSHSNAQMQQVHSFRMGGAVVNDYAKVQAHIDGLESFRQESIDGARKDFVDGLVGGNIVTGPQGVAFHGLVKTMNPDQFTAFKAGFEGMASSNLFGKHDLGGGGGADDAKSDRIAVLENIVANHRATGISQEDLAKKNSFLELQTLKTS